MVKDNVPSHKIDFVAQLLDTLNPECFKSCIIGSKFTAVLPFRVVEFHREGSATSAVGQLALFLTDPV